jgi:nucleotide-binding universal stress UspA family protein
MRALVWVTENSWEECVDRAREILPAGTEVTLLHVSPSDVEELARAGPASRLGRRPPPPPGPPLRLIAAEEAQELLGRARARLGRDAELATRRGRVEREVVAACADQDLLILARGGRIKLSPESLGHHARFIVDHAPCQVLLVWPEPPPGIETLKGPPPHPRRH